MCYSLLSSWQELKTVFVVTEWVRFCFLVCVWRRYQPNNNHKQTNRKKKHLFTTSLNFLDIYCFAIIAGPFDCKRQRIWQENGVRVDTVSRRCWWRISLPNMFRRFGGTSSGNCWLSPLYKRLYMWWSLFVFFFCCQYFARAVQYIRDLVGWFLIYTYVVRSHVYCMIWCLCVLVRCC